MGDLADVLEEADELVNRFRPTDVGETWQHNLEAVTVLMVIHRCWQDDAASVGDLIKEMRPFLRVAFEMGKVAGEQL
jgi:hypothetical protein